MTINLGSQLLDLLFALAFIYFLLSLIVSACTEAFSWFLQQRARNLKGGLAKLLADPKAEKAITKSVLAHPLISSLVKERKYHLPKVELPSYVSPRNFALAFVDVLIQKNEENTAQPQTILAELLKDPKLPDDPKLPKDPELPDDLRRQLLPLLTAVGGDISKFRTSVEKWYDDAMARVSGWYKRWAQMVTIIVAVAVTIGFNVDTVRVADRLFADEAVRQSVVSAANKQLESAKSSSATISEAPSDPTEAGTKAQEATDTLEALKLPIGWGADNDDVNLASVGGWLLTIVAISIGAPFWFDALGRLARLRTTGAKPEATDARPPAT